MRLMRESRSACSTGIGFSPRAFRDSAVSCAAPAADLDELVEDLPAQLGAVELGDRGLDADVVALLVGQARGDVEHRLQAEGGGGDERVLLRHGVVLAHRTAPLDALGRPLARRSSSPTWTRPTEIAGSERRPVLSVDRAILRPQPSLPIRFSCRHEDVLELGDRVLDPLQAHERVAVRDRHALGRVVHDEGADAALVALGLGHARHHDHDVGDRAVGGPQLGAVEDVAALGRHGGRRHARRVRARRRARSAGTRRCRFGHARQPLALLRPRSRTSAAARPRRSTDERSAARPARRDRCRPAPARGCGRPARARGRRIRWRPSSPSRRSP